MNELTHRTTSLDAALELTKSWLEGASGKVEAKEVVAFLTDVHDAIVTLTRCVGIERRIDVKDLELIPHASTAAKTLEENYPDAIFTSGRRSVEKQAQVMATNILQNRRYIEQTYAASAERDQLQRWIDDNPQAVTSSEIAAGLIGLMNVWSDDQKLRISRHFAGLAFDISPSSGDAVKAAIKQLPELVKFLENEGGLVRWHAEFRKK